jgi:hypothetical protein
MINYLLAVLAMGAGFVLNVLFSGGRIIDIWDVPSVVIMVVFPLLYQWALFGSSGFRKAFTAGFKKAPPVADVKTAQLFFRSYEKIIWFSALSSFVISITTMLIDLEDRSGLGVHLAIMLISLIYAVILEVLVIVPFLVILKRRTIELNAEI